MSPSRLKRQWPCNGFVTYLALTGEPNGCSQWRMPHQRCRLLLVDGHAIVRRGLMAVLTADPDLLVCGEVSRGEDAIEKVSRGRLDVVVLELDLPDVSGLEIIPKVGRLSPETEILVFTVYSSPAAARAALDAGARGYVLKSDTQSELIRAVHTVWRHERFVTQQITQRDSGVQHCSRPRISRCEAVVMKMLASGLDNPRIALVLGISRRTVEAHREHLMRKLHCASFSELIRVALRDEAAGSLNPGAASVMGAPAPGYSRSALYQFRAARSERNVSARNPSGSQSVLTATKDCKSTQVSKCPSGVVQSASPAQALLGVNGAGVPSRSSHVQSRRDVGLWPAPTLASGRSRTALSGTGRQPGGNA